jgi:hypothetical protein
MKTLRTAAHYAAPVETGAAELAAKTGAPARRSDRQRALPAGGWRSWLPAASR